MMKKLISILLLLICLSSFGQQTKLKPFRLIVLPPDTAIIDASLFSDIDSIHADHLKEYYHGIKTQEYLINVEKQLNVPRSKNDRLEKEILLMKAQESEIKKFKYFHLLSLYSTRANKSFFKQFKDSIGSLNNAWNVKALKGLADHFGADYVIRFSNIHTERKSDGLVLMLTTSLYSRKDDNIIWTKETEGDAISREQWECGNKLLSCLLANGARTSVNEVIPVITNLQLLQ